MKNDETSNENQTIINSQSSSNVQINRGRLDAVNIYEINGSELKILENGSTKSIYFNFSIFLLSIAVSFFSTLLTANFSGKIVVEIVFIVISVVGFLVGIFLLLLWFTKRDNFKETIEKIKDRIDS